MKLSDLNKIDIKDLQKIDLEQIKYHLQRRPDLLINIVLIGVTCIVLFSTYRSHTDSKISSGVQTAKLQKKIDALEKYEIAKKQYNEYAKDIPKAISDDQLINTLSEFAIRRNVQILSFSPAKKRSNRLIDLTSVEVNITSENYSNIILFAHDIETSPYYIRIEKLSGSSKSPGTERTRNFYNSSEQRNKATSSKDQITATITIGSVELKNV